MAGDKRDHLPWYSPKRHERRGAARVLIGLPFPANAHDEKVGGTRMGEANDLNPWPSADDEFTCIDVGSRCVSNAMCRN
jgi:hypothetical protein